ncbi:MAG: ATP-grasp domain-containing protein [Bacillota bacterium]
MTKKILIIALAKDWTGISRLPSGLKRAGFEVAALCPSGSYLSKTRYLDQRFTYPTFTYTRSKFIYLLMLLAIQRVHADLIVAGDEEALLALQNLANFCQKVPILSRYSMEIRRSIAAPEYDQIVLNKSRFVDKCSQWGISVPKNIRVENIQMALEKASEFGYPLVLKFDFGYGSSGVTICHNSKDLKKGFAKHRKAGLLAKVKSFVKQLFFVVQEEQTASISLQQYVSGQVGQVPFSAKDGVMFAVNPMLKYRTYPGETGPSSVSVGIESQEMEKAAEIVAREMKYTGFGSLDFIIDEKTQKPYVIEMNPRPIPPSHFSSELCAVDLCEALYKGLNSIVYEPKPFRPYMVALFPNEKRRDPLSECIRDGYHDIPKDDPELMAALDG